MAEESKVREFRLSTMRDNDRARRDTETDDERQHRLRRMRERERERGSEGTQRQMERDSRDHCNVYP